MPVSANGTHIVFNDNSTQAFGFTGPVAAANITGTITGPQIAPGTITAPNIAPGVIPSGGFSNMQVFSSPGAFTTPPTTTKIKVTVVGGGGGGGGVGGSNAGNGGGAGGAAIRVTPVTAATPYPVTIGPGGAAPGPSGVGGTGGTSSFGALASATGGIGGSPCAMGRGGIGSSGDLNLRGASSIYRFQSQVDCGGVGSPGGNSILGGGGHAGSDTTPTLAVGQTGSGGAGRTTFGSFAGPGFAGGAGVVIVEF